MERPVVQPLERTAGWPETIKGLGVAPLPSNDTEGLPEQSHALPTSLADSQNSYQYQHLNGVDEFRLLIISPGSFDDALHGEVITTKFSGTDRPVYEALSYTWADQAGDDERSCEFLCGQDHEELPGCNTASSSFRKEKVVVD